jgi:hypothetical protein
MSTPLSARQIWGMPIALGILSAIGLASALLGDGLWDFVSWIALAAPVAVIVRSLVRRRSS